MHDLIHVIESLAGLPVEVGFLDFKDVTDGALKDYDVLINAGRAGDAWSGGDVWKDPQLQVCISKWVYEGGTFIGVGQPSAAEGTDTFYRLANVLGVDEDTGAKVCHGKWTFDTADPQGLVPEGCALPVRGGRFLTDGKAQVLLSHDGYPDMTKYSFGIPTFRPLTSSTKALVKSGTSSFTLVESISSRPQIMFKILAQSVTSLVIGPIWSKEEA